MDISIAPVPLLARVTLWLFVILLGLDLGAGIYETRIVVPLWSGGVPETLQDGNPYGRVAIDAGMRLWAFLTSAVALASLLALIFGAWSSPQRTWQIAAAVLELVVVAATLLYFRPVLIRLFMGHGAGLSGTELTAIVRRWVMLGRVRVALSFIAWLAALYALSL